MELHQYTIVFSSSDVSPPKSPSPELNEVMQALSSSSSVEIVPETPNEDMSMTELVQEKIASLGLTNCKLKYWQKHT